MRSDSYCLKLIFIVVFLLLVILSQPIEARKDKGLFLEEITCEHLVKRIRVSLSFTEPVRFIVKKLRNPARIVIGIHGEKLYADEKRDYLFNKDIVQRVRLKYSDDKKKEAPYIIEYLVLELERFTSEKIHTKGNVLMVDVNTPREKEKGAIPFIVDRLTGRGDLISKDLKEFIEHFKEKYRKRPEEVLRIEGKANLSKCVEVALYNSTSCKIATEEIELAKVREREATRNLYPFVSSEWEETEGEQAEELGLPAFHERSFGLRGAQAITEGGYLLHALEKARLEKDLAQQKYRKESRDLISQVREAYLDLAGKLLKNKERKELLKKVQPIFDRVKEKYKLGLISKVEYLESNFVYNRIRLQKDLGEKELNLARLNLLELLNVELFPLEIDTSLKYGKEDISFEQCFSLAVKNNVDLAISELEKDIAKHQMKIAQSERGIKSELDGFYGRSGAAFEPDKIHLSGDWEIKADMFKDISCGTFTTQASRKKTTPKVGQSTREEETRGVVRMGIVDNLKLIVRERESNLRQKNALWKFREEKKKIQKDVKRAYLDYLDAMERMKLVEKEKEFREEALKVLKHKNKLNLVPDKVVMDALLDLAGAKVEYTDALVVSKKALVNLNSMMGKNSFDIQ